MVLRSLAMEDFVSRHRLRKRVHLYELIVNSVKFCTCRGPTTLLLIQRNERNRKMLNKKKTGKKEHEARQVHRNDLAERMFARPMRMAGARDGHFLGRIPERGQKGTGYS